jgi:hypothetical protein
MRLFYNLYETLRREALSATTLGSQTAGYKSSIETGKGYLDALFITAIKMRQVKSETEKKPAANRR